MWRFLPLLLMACAFWPAASGTSSEGPSRCPTDKITFTQAEGCFNDGSVEFCIPAHDPEALQTVLTIAPQTTCIQAGGRARCNVNTELLCMVDTQKMCLRMESPISEAGWQTICDLAQLSFIRQVVPTWYE
jgi:hypothetical protein